MTTIGIICGGPSKERGISLNSARSLFDHLTDTDISFCILYVDQTLHFYVIDQAKLYSNTPADFDYQLAQYGAPLSESAYLHAIACCDLIFPCIHGEFGEDGQLQAIMESAKVSFVGSSSDACRISLDKWLINQRLSQNGYPVFPMLALTNATQHQVIIGEKIQSFLGVSDGRAVLKPRSSGSSIGVKVIHSQTEANQHLAHLAALNITKVVIEAYSEGQEFTVLVLQNSKDEAVALPVTEIIFDKSRGDEIFDYRRKYLPTHDTRRTCPPLNFSAELENNIRTQAEQVFALFGMRDIGRIDGFVTIDNKVVFTDLNPLGGMEQNSFIFQQASRIGWHHKDVLTYLANRALKRAGKPLIKRAKGAATGRKPVYILLGGNTPERQVSVMSGTNVWLKLLNSTRYEPVPFLFLEEEVWRLPYGYCLDHTVEEILENCQMSCSRQADIVRLSRLIRERMGATQTQHLWPQPKCYPPKEFFELAVANQAFVFIALHGGYGEDGRLQAELTRYQIPFNGSAAACAQLCMDKLATGEAIKAANIVHLSTMPKFLIKPLADISSSQSEQLWCRARQQLGNSVLIAKPRLDGCSAGIVPLVSAQELDRYLNLLGSKMPAPIGTFQKGKSPIDMDFDATQGVLLEPYIAVTKLQIYGATIAPTQVSGWLELTVGVTTEASDIKALEPSITVAQDSILSLEEKFQGGTGVNLTPPTASLVTPEQQDLIKSLAKQAAKVLGIKGYARLDIFFHTVSHEVILIEANTLPGLTPSTVIFHQALAATPSRNPKVFLEHLINNKL